MKVNDWRIRTIHKAVSEDKHVPIDKILKYKQNDYYRNASLCYAQGWSMNYFFLSKEGQKRGYHTLPRRMINELKTTGNADKARIRVFAGVNLKTLEAEWKKFVLALPVPEDKKPKPGFLVVADPPTRKVADPAKPKPPARGKSRKVEGEVNLIPMVDSKQDALIGDWSVQGGALLVPTEEFARLQFPYIPPEEYDIRITAARTGPNESFLIGLVGGGRSFAVILNGWRGTFSGLHRLDGQAGNANESTVAGAVFPDTRPRNILVNVRKTGIAVWLDGKTLIAWKGDFKRLSQNSGWRVRRQDVLWLGALNSCYKVTDYKVTPVTGTGQATR